MSDDDASPRVCTGCGTIAPETDTSYTLISSEHGWRLRRYLHHGGPIAEWWCASCWVDLKKASGGVVSMTPPTAFTSKRKPGGK